MLCWLTETFQATAEDIEIIYDVCWMLSPMQIQRMCTNYYVADYEVWLSHKEIIVLDLQKVSEPYFTRNSTYCRIARHCERPERPSFITRGGRSRSVRVTLTP